MPEITKSVRSKPDGTKITKVKIKAKEGRGVSIMQKTDGQATISVEAKQPPAEVVQPLPDYTTIMTLGVVVAVLVWGIVEVVKMGFSSWKKKHNGSTPWYWGASLRLGSLVLGAAAGTALYDPIVGGSGFPWGTAVGAGGGALCTIIVGVVKKLIHKKGA